MRGLGRQRLLVLLSLTVLLLSACRVDTTVDIRIAEDGTGVVELTAAFDAAAVDALDGLATEVFLNDLRGAGWNLAAPITDASGSVVFEASKTVPSADALQPILDEIVGPGVFVDVDVTTADTFGAHRQTLNYSVDLRQGWGLLSDPALTASLGGEPFGVPIDDLTDGRDLDELVSVEITSTLLGADVDSRSTTIVNPRFDDNTSTAITVTTLREESLAQVVRWISWALAALAVLAFVLAATGLWIERRSDRLRPEPTPKKLTSRIPASRDAEGLATTAADPSSTVTPGDDGPVRLVILNPLHVLYSQREAQRNVVLAFVRNNGGQTRADEIVDVLDQVQRGRTETANLWQVAGLDGDPEAIDKRFLAGRTLRKDAVGFLKELGRRRIPVAAVGDDAQTWSAATRERDRLSAVWPWVVSATVGATTPDTGMFERLRRDTGVSYNHCLYIDTVVENLDAARELGMRTAFYAPDRKTPTAFTEHVTVHELAALVPRERARPKN